MTPVTDHSFWRERRTEAVSNLGPSAAYQPNALPLGHTGSQGGISQSSHMYPDLHAEQRSSSFVTHSSLPPLRQSHTRCSASETGDRWVTGDVTSVCRLPPGAARRLVLNCHYSLTLKRRGRYTRLFGLSTRGPTHFKLFIKVTEGLKERNVRATDRWARSQAFILRSLLVVLLPSVVKYAPSRWK